MAYTAAVITISDKGARGERVDTSGPALCAMLKESGYDVAYTNIIPDEKDQIKAELISCADEKNIALVLTTGGTGFSPRDITPEATMEVIERHTPGIPEAMRTESLRITPKGCLSRSEAGIRGKTLIVNLPGSEKAAKENLTAVLSALDPGLDMLYSAGQIDDQRLTADTGLAAAEAALGGDAQALGTHGFRDSGGVALNDLHRRFRSDITGGEAGASGGQHQSDVFFVGTGNQLCFDLILFVGDDVCICYIITGLF